MGTVYANTFIAEGMTPVLIVLQMQSSEKQSSPDLQV
jgi:hypothetical protein